MGRENDEGNREGLVDLIPADNDSAIRPDTYSGLNGGESTYGVDTPTKEEAAASGNHEDPNEGPKHQS